jgi:hypothetical protein
LTSKIGKLQKNLRIIIKEIENLKGFRDTSFTRRFGRQLEGEKSVLLQKIKNATATKEEKEQIHASKQAIANRNRSSKMTRQWNFFRSIQENYLPDKSLKWIRSQYSRFRRGLENDVSDVVWRNPSP